MVQVGWNAPQGRVCGARGVSQYAADDVRRIAGRHSRDIQALLGYNYGGSDTPMSGIETPARACRAAALVVAGLDSAARRSLLLAMAQALEVNAGLILAGNARDLAAAREKGVGTAMLDRLALDPPRLVAMAEAVREVAGLPDPVGQVTRDDVRPNGIRVQKVRVPLGVIAMIYEARPNVTAEAAALCLKAGNGVILRGGQRRTAGGGDRADRSAP
ncbi:hypothetical protein G6F59_014668 [Rhizopus arrhizus]|nr:hypothetical protein G6F59_014668 [Rhizopus arrhizus]